MDACLCDTIQLLEAAGPQSAQLAKGQQSSSITPIQYCICQRTRLLGAPFGIRVSFANMQNELIAIHRGELTFAGGR